MNKKAFLEETYNSAFEDELEKIALSTKTLSSALRKAAIKANKYDVMGRAFLLPEKNMDKSRMLGAKMLKLKRPYLNKAIKTAKEGDSKRLRGMLQSILSESKLSKSMLEKGLLK